MQWTNIDQNYCTRSSKVLRHVQKKANIELQLWPNLEIGVGARFVDKVKVHATPNLQEGSFFALYSQGHKHEREAVNRHHIVRVKDSNVPFSFLSLFSRLSTIPCSQIKCHLSSSKPLEYHFPLVQRNCPQTYSQAFYKPSLYHIRTFIYDTTSLQAQVLKHMLHGDNLKKS